MNYKFIADSACILRMDDNAIIPTDTANRDYVEYLLWVKEGNTPEPAPHPSRNDLDLAIRNGVYGWIDEVMRGNDYDNVTTCLTYQNSTVPKFKAEAEAALAWRDAVALKLIELQQTRPEGVTTLADVLALMPQPEEFGWVRDPSPNVGPYEEETLGLLE